MKKLLLLTSLIAFTTFGVKAQNCGSFTTGTVCSQAPSGQQKNCCLCRGTESQNASFCGGTPINKGLIALIIGGLVIGTYAAKKQFNFELNSGSNSSSIQ